MAIAINEVIVEACPKVVEARPGLKDAKSWCLNDSGLKSFSVGVVYQLIGVGVPGQKSSVGWGAVGVELADIVRRKTYLK